MGMTERRVERKKMGEGLLDTERQCEIRKETIVKHNMGNGKKRRKEVRIQ
jgi:hypothetical protein